MRFKEFLLEDKGRSQEISSKQAIQWLRTNAKSCFKYDAPFVLRGVGNASSDFLFVSPSQHQRQSANTTNEYTTFIDNDPSWSKFPKRSKSIICGTRENLSYMRDFGEIHMVFPKDRAKFGVCSDFDFWTSFKYMRKVLGTTFSMDDLNSAIRDLSAGYGEYGKSQKGSQIKIPKNNTDYNLLLKAFDQITSFLRNEAHKVLKNTYKDVSSGEKTFEEFYRDLIDPEKNDFKLMTYGQLKNISTSRELWTDSDCVLVKIKNEFEDTYLKIQNEVLGDD